MEIEDDEILQGFIEESLEHLADIETDLLAIEAAGQNIDEELVNKVFRAAHSIKGGAGFMGLTTIEELSHSIENVLGMIRSRKLIPTPEIVNVFLLAADQLRNLIKDIINSNEVDISSHITPLSSIADGSFEQPAAANGVASDTNAETVTEQTPPGPLPEKNTTTGIQGKVDASLRVQVSLLDSLMNLAGELVLSRNQLLQSINSTDLRHREAVGQRINLITSELQEAIMLTRMQPIGNVFNKFPRIVRDLSSKLSKVIDLTIIGRKVELDKTIIEAINDPLTHLIRNAVDHGIETIENRRKYGKPENGQIILKAYHAAGQVVIEISDDGKGLDGEALGASAVKKGLFSVEQVKAMSAKEKVNLIFMPGFSTADEVTDVSGRGVGMDVVKTNLDQLSGQVDITSEINVGTTISIKLPLTLAIIPCQIIEAGGERYAIPQINLEELLRIPAAHVKERVEKVGDAEVVRLRGHLLPLIRLADVIDIERTYLAPDTSQYQIDRRKLLHDRRGMKSPLFKDTDKPKIHPPVIDNPSQRSVTDRRYTASSALNIIVVSTGSMKYGLVVDRFLDSEEIVIKPLGRHLKQCKGYAGATIMGDRRIALILDVNNLSIMANLTSIDGSDRAADVAREEEKAALTKIEMQSLLTFKSSEKEHFGVPLNQVERIEKINRSDIESPGGKRVMKYRGGSLNLICVDDVSQVEPLADHDSYHVIVFTLCNKLVGLLSTGPIDAAEVPADIDDTALVQPGIMGSVIIDGQTTMLVNISEIAQSLFPHWFEGKNIKVLS